MILISILPRESPAQHRRERLRAAGRARMRRLRETDPEKVREYQRQWREDNREHTREYKRQWRLENPDKVRAESRTELARERQRRAREKEKADPVLRERRRAYGRAFARTEKGKALRAKQTGTPKAKARRQRWIARGGLEKWKKSPSGAEAIRRGRHKRLAASRGVVSMLTLREWDLLLLAYGNKCAYCDRCGEMTRDHVMPITKAGGDVIDNVVPACRPCNSRKRDWAPTVAFGRFGIDPVTFWSRHEQIVARIRGEL